MNHIKRFISHYPCGALPKRNIYFEEMYSKELLKNNINYWALFFLCLICITDVDNLNCAFLWSFLIMTFYIPVLCASGRRESQERHMIWHLSKCQLISLYTCATQIYHLNSLPEFRKYLHPFPFATAIREKRSLFSN